MIRRAAALMGLAALAAGPLAAQAASSDRAAGHTWHVEGLRAGFCVQFLVDSATTREILGDELQPVPASAAKDLHPALARVIADQPEFASATPSRLCFLFADAVAVEQRRISEDRREKAPMVGTWSLATSQGDRIVRLFTNNWRVVKPAEVAFINVERIEGRVDTVSGGSGDRYDMKFGKTRVVWDGRETADSATAPGAVEHRGVVAGRRGTVWSLATVVNPAVSRPLVGALRVEGKDELARALKGSPIRYVGPLYRGGGGRLEFTRQ